MKLTTEQVAANLAETAERYAHGALTLEDARSAISSALAHVHRSALDSARDALALVAKRYWKQGDIRASDAVTDSLSEIDRLLTAAPSTPSTGGEVAAPPPTGVAPDFDPDLSPAHEQNRMAAAARGWRYMPSLEVYVDEDGCPVRDRFGQVLG